MARHIAIEDFQSRFARHTRPCGYPSGLFWNLFGTFEENRHKSGSRRRDKNTVFSEDRGGGRTRARTWDPMIKSHLLYQLSYAPGTGPESLRKRASFSKATLRCPAKQRGFPGHRQGPRIAKKPLESSGLS